MWRAMTPEKQEETRMSYVDGFIVAVPKKNLDAYVRLSKKCGKVWREYGALDYREWVADDVKVGKRTSFPRAVKLKPGEVVVFAWITYKSRAQRDKINAKVMADPRLKEMTEEKPPFDGKRLIFGGFESLVTV
jgi:uncharacterized protein YbaA (DUF1428 family)